MSNETVIFSITDLVESPAAYHNKGNVTQDICSKEFVESGAEDPREHSDVEEEHASDYESNHGSDYDDGSVGSSLAETEEYDHEPLEAFQHKVQAFAKRVLVPQNSSHRFLIEVERKRGGAYNRIIPITIRDKGGMRSSNRGTTAKNFQILKPWAWRLFRKCFKYHTHEGTQEDDNQEGHQDSWRYILRIPREESDWYTGRIHVDRDVAALCLVEQKTTIPAPRVVCFEAINTDNELGAWYMVQTRLPGTQVLWTYTQGLDHQKRCQLAAELGDVYRQMLETQSRVPGIPVLPTRNTPISPAPTVRIAPFPAARQEDAVDFNDANAPVPSMRQVIADLLNYRRVEKQSEIPDPSDGWVFDMFYDACIVMAREMEERGVFDNVPYSLVHDDLEVYNILVDSDANLDKGEPVLTGVLDWDRASIAPAFMACKPPFWLWGWKEGEEEDERTANDVPETVEQQELKALFEAAAGPIYMRFAYEPMYRVARTLMEMATRPNRCNEMDKRWDAARQEWHELKQPGAMAGWRADSEGI